MNETEATIMQLERRHVEALDQAERQIVCCNYCSYFDLKALLTDPSPLARQRFRVLFAKFYDLNQAHLTDDFKEVFFEIMFDGPVIVDGKTDWYGIFAKLNGIKRKKGDSATQFSFVSKLVGMHLESSPLCDQHVLTFFRASLPQSKLETGKRVAQFEAFLGKVGRSYTSWAADVEVKPILDRFKARDARLRSCHDVRLLDFLVWKVGNGKLLPKAARTK